MHAKMITWSLLLLLLLLPLPTVPTVYTTIARLVTMLPIYCQLSNERPRAAHRTNSVYLRNVWNIHEAWRQLRLVFEKCKWTRDKFTRKIWYTKLHYNMYVYVYEYIVNCIYYNTYGPPSSYIKKNHNLNTFIENYIKWLKIRSLRVIRT